MTERSRRRDEELRLAALFGANLRRVRRARRLSRARLAQVAGAPLAVLAELEGGRAAPTLDAAWRLAAALDVPFSVLTGAPPEAPALAVIRAGEGEVVARGVAGATRALFPLGRPQPAEAYELSLLPGKSQRWRPRGAGAVETVLLHAGALEIGSGGEVARLAVRDAATVRADRPRVFRNPGRAPALAFVVLAWGDPATLPPLPARAPGVPATR